MSAVPRRTRGPASPTSFRRSVCTIVPAISSCKPNTSSISRSYRSDQSWNPSAVLTSCAVTRRRVPAVRTLPSSTESTDSSRPMRRASSARPLNWNADERAATRRPSTRASAWISSSAIPSQIGSWSFCGLMSTNGRTAIARRGPREGRAVDAPAAIASSSPASAEADGTRRSGSFASRRSSSASSGRDAPVAPGSSRRIDEIESMGVRPRNGFEPVSISWRITPSENRSLRASTRSPRACSGDMYAAVPTSDPSTVRCSVRVSASCAPASSLSRCFATPKSRIFARPSEVRMTFSGLRSRWTTPAA